MEDTDFGNRIAQGPLLILLMLGIAKRSPWEADAIALYGYDNIRFTNPVYIDDTLYVESEVTDKEDKDEDSGVITFHRRLKKADDTLAMTADVKVLVRKAGD